MSNPFQDATALADPETAKPVQQADPISSDGNPFESAQTLADPDPSAPAQKVQGAGTPEHPFQAVITFSQKIQEAREVGQLGFRESAIGHAVKDGRLTLDEAEKQIADDDRMAQLSGDIDAYEKAAWGNWLTGIPTSISLATARQLPMLEESLKPMAAGAALGAGAAAATGGGLPLAVPVGAMTGTAAAAGWAADLITGQEYLQRRRAGMPHKEALDAASISGVIQGSLQGLRFGQAAKLPLNTAKNIMQAHAQSMTRFLSEGVKFGGLQLTLAEAQTATKLITDAVSGTISKTPNVIPTLESAATEFWDTFTETLKASIGLFLGGKAAGTATGLTAKSLLKGLNRAHDAHIQKQQAKIEKIQEHEQTANAPDAQNEPQQAGVSKSAAERQRRAVLRLEKRKAAETEVNRIFDAAASRFVVETDESRIQEVNRIQRLLKRMVTNSDKLDEAMKSKLLGRIVEIDGVKDLLREGRRFLDEQVMQEDTNELKAAVGQLAKAIKAGQMKDKKAAMSPAAQASLKWYQEFFSLPKREKGQAVEDQWQQAHKKAVDYVEKGIEEEKQQVADQLEKLENNELSELFNQPAELAEKRRIAMEAARFWGQGLNTEEIQKLTAQVEAIVDSGKSEFLERKQEEIQSRLNSRQQVLEGVQGIKPVTPSIADTAPKQISGLGKLLHSLRRTSTSLWDKLLQDTPVEQREKLVRDVLDFTDVENRESAINLRATEKLTELFQNSVGTIRESNRLIRNGIKNEKFDAQYTDVEGNTQIIGRHSLNELVYLHMAMEDPGAVSGLVHGNKYTLDGMVEPGQTSTQEAVRRILQERDGGKYLKLAESVKDFYRWFAPQIANHYLKEYGVTLPTDPNYSGQIFHRNIERFKNAADLIEDVHQYAKQTLDPGSVKLRKNSRLPVRLVDPFAQVQRHRSQMAFWMANSEKARNLSFIFSDTSKDGLRDVIQHKLGKEYTGLIDGRLAWQFHLKPGIMDIADKSYQGIKNNLATGLLGAKFDQAPKQWTSVLAALSTNDFSQFADGLKEATNKERLQEYLSKSELYADRQNELLPQILEATKERSYLDAVTGDRLLDLKSFSLIPMSQWGDGVASALTGFIEYNRVRKNGGSVQEAITAGDALVDRSQSSSRASQKVPAEFKGGIGNVSLAFAKQNIQMQNLESGAIRDFFIHKDKAHAAKALRTMFGIHAAQALFQSINSAPAWVVGDEQEQHDAALRIVSAALGGSYSQLPLLGYDAIYGALSGWKGNQEPRTIIGGLAGDLAKLVKRWGTIAVDAYQGEEIEGERWVKAFQSLALAASIGTGLPFYGLFKTIGYSKELAEKAQGEQ